MKKSQFEEQIVRGIKNGQLRVLHIAFPCDTLSMARRDDGGPVALRNDDNLWGLPGLDFVDRVRVKMQIDC